MAETAMATGGDWKHLYLFHTVTYYCSIVLFSHYKTEITELQLKTKH